MPPTFEEARGQRNWLERLGAKIPGYRGFQDRELRRDVDKRLREQLASQLDQLRNAAREKARGLAAAGVGASAGALALLDRLDKRLDGLAQAIGFADYGQTGFFDAVKIGEAELVQLYQLDLTLVEGVVTLGGDLKAISASAGDPATALQAALSRLQALEAVWSARKLSIGEVKPAAR